MIDIILEYWDRAAVDPQPAHALGPAAPQQQQAQAQVQVQVHAPVVAHGQAAVEPRLDVHELSRLFLLELEKTQMGAALFHEACTLHVAWTQEGRREDHEGQAAVRARLGELAQQATFQPDPHHAQQEHYHQVGAVCVAFFRVNGRQQTGFAGPAARTESPRGFKARRSCGGSSRNQKNKHRP